ncbi:MAG TPA: hypothetical protein VME46_25385, partial [Acidimicrobiales bacterium]|nr:hypothetical protein [Acidimicrobiales bacterium]
VALVSEHAREVTLLGVSASNLVPGALQLALPLRLDGKPDVAMPGAEGAQAERRASVDGSVDAIRARFGRTAVGYATTVFGAGPHVPDAFRELAEHSPGR